MKYIKHFDSGNADKKIAIINELFIPLGIKFKHRSNTKRLIITFQLSKGIFLSILKSICPNFISSSFMKNDICVDAAFFDLPYNINFLLRKFQNYFKTIDDKLYLCTKNINSIATSFTRPYLPLFKNIVISYLEYILNTKNGSVDELYKIIADELSKSGLDYKVFNILKEIDIDLYNKIISHNTNIDIASDMGDIGF